MTDALIQSAIHTVRIWKRRREYKNGSTLADVEIAAHVRDLWPSLGTTQVWEIVKGAQHMPLVDVANLQHVWAEADAAVYDICHATPANMTKAAERLQAARLKMRDAVWALATEAGQ